MSPRVAGPSQHDPERVDGLPENSLTSAVWVTLARSTKHSVDRPPDLGLRELRIERKAHDRVCEFLAHMDTRATGASGMGTPLVVVDRQKVVHGSLDAEGV